MVCPACPAIAVATTTAVAPTLIAAATTTITAIVTTAYYYLLPNTPKQLYPFSPKDPSLLNSIPQAPCMKGTDDSDLLIANPKGSKMYGQGGLDFFQGSEGADEFYFNVCKTNVIDGQITRVTEFNQSKDKLLFYCSKTQLNHDYITLSYNHTQNATYISVITPLKQMAIALDGNVTPSIELNTPFIQACPAAQITAEPIDELG